MFIEREAFRQQGLTGDIEQIDNMISRGLLQKDKVDKFWRSVQDIILDRMSRKMLKKRPTADDEEVKTYATTKEPKLDIEHLNEYTKGRIDNLTELLDLRSRSQVDRLRGQELKDEYAKKSQQAIWDARTWLYQKQMIDDFVLFTMVNNTCIDSKVETQFNLRRAFKSFVSSQSRPSHAIQVVVEEKKKGEAEVQKDQPIPIE